MLKAVREAKVHTSWVNANEAYEAALRAFVERVVVDDPDDPFRRDFEEVRRPVAYFGVFNALSQLLVKLAAPGVPEIYQGTELWDDSLVDPDNRRPVDFARRGALLAELRAAIVRAGGDLRPLAAELVASAADGRIKLFLTRRGLGARREHAELFRDGAYRPLGARGPGGQHLVAFARVLGRDAVVAIAPRLTLRLAGGALRPPLGAAAWGDTRLILPPDLPADRYENLLTGEPIRAARDHDGAGLAVAEALGAFPVALLRGRT
jgi:(1->4)-alpha-D-glucan 1-alpha-D-glucosylmutase